MAYQERDYQQRLSLAQRSNTLITLISINLILFVILAFINAFYHMKYEGLEADQQFDRAVLYWFTLPADVHQLAVKPWAIFTHMFSHIRLMHIIGNMIWLWFFGYILHDLTGNRKIFPIYIYGGLAGALAFMLALNFVPSLKASVPGAEALGASASIMAVAVAVTTLSPTYRIFPMLNGGIPIWILTVIYLIIDLATISFSSPGTHIAHLAGGVTGFLFINSYRRGVDWGAWMNNFFDWVNDLFNPERPKKGRSVKKELFYKSGANPYRKTPNVTGKRVDEILDKINQHGYHSLTEEEKELLKKASKEDF